MNIRDARSVGRYCEKHKQKHRRIHMDNGAQTTMCPDCAAGPAFKEAVDALVEAATKWAETREAPPA